MYTYLNLYTYMYCYGLYFENTIDIWTQSKWGQKPARAARIMNMSEFIGIGI